MYKGIAGSEGIGIGTVVLIEEHEINIETKRVEETGAEIERLQNAIEKFVADTNVMAEKMDITVGKKDADILRGHIQMLQDPTIEEQITALIVSEKITAEKALDQVLEQTAEIFAQIPDELLQQRATDFRDIKARILKILLGIEDYDISAAPAGTVLVAHDLTPSMTAGIVAENIADHIESMTDYDFAHLLFSDGDVVQSISLDRQLNIIQVADLVLPDKDTKFEEYTTMELLSVAMLIVISTFALDFIHSDRSIFKMVDLDEAWTFLQVAQGKALSNKLIRAGRSMNAAVYFVTQNSGDVDDEKMKNNIGLKFAFRSTDIKEIKNTLEFFGVDKEDEGNQKRLRDLENGQCLFQDLYGRVGVIQIHPVFADLFHAFDTRPPVQTEEMR